MAANKCISWNNIVYNKQKDLNENINSEDTIKARIGKSFLKDFELGKVSQEQLDARREFCTYKPKKANIVYWAIPNKNKILFRFELDNFNWNDYNKEFEWTNLYECLKEINAELINEFPELYNGTNFITYLESLRLDYKHSISYIL